MEQDYKYCKIAATKDYCGVSSLKLWSSCHSNNF